MKIALLSDIHGNLLALEAVMAHLQGQGVQQVFNLGDSLSGPLLPLQTARLLMQQGWPTIAGNHERQLLTLAPECMGASDAYAHAQLTPDVFDWLRQLPENLRPEPGVLLCHGTPASDVQYFLHTVAAGHMRLATQQELTQRLGGEDAALVACGHTHLPGVVQTATGQTLVNPGSVGLPAYDDDHGEPHVSENGSPHARYAVVERLPAQAGKRLGSGWAVSFHAVPYDHEAMACVAERNGRPDWARALRTGRM